MKAQFPRTFLQFRSLQQLDCTKFLRICVMEAFVPVCVLKNKTIRRMLVYMDV